MTMLPSVSLGAVIAKANEEYGSLKSYVVAIDDLREMADSGEHCVEEWTEIDYDVLPPPKVEIIPIVDWICTDNIAGFQLIGNGEKVLGYRFRAGRKCHWDCRWLSIEDVRYVCQEFSRFVRPEPPRDVALISEKSILSLDECEFTRESAANMGKLGLWAKQKGE